MSQVSPSSPLRMHSCIGMHLEDLPDSEPVFQTIPLCLRVLYMYWIFFFYIGSTISKEFYWQRIFLLVATKVFEQLN